MNRRDFAAVGAMLALHRFAHATGTLDKPVRIVAPSAPGTSTDSLARVLAGHMGKQWGIQVYVENKPGAGGVLATEIVAKAPADGSTILMTNASHYTLPSLFKGLTFDPQNGFEPLAGFASSALLVTVAANSRFRSIQDVVAEAKKRPGELTYASAGVGTTAHIGGELLNSLGGVRLSHVPYKATAQAITDTASGQIDLTTLGTGPAMPLIQSGRLRPLAITSLKRSALMPEVPTVDESGLKGFEVVSPIFALAPAGTPAPIVAMLADGIMKAAATDEFREVCTKLVLDVEIVDPAALRRQVPVQFERWKKLVELTGATAN